MSVDYATLSQAKCCYSVQGMCSTELQLHIILDYNIYAECHPSMKLYKPCSQFQFLMQLHDIVANSGWKLQIQSDLKIDRDDSIVYFLLLLYVPSHSDLHGKNISSSSPLRVQAQADTKYRVLKYLHCEVFIYQRHGHGGGDMDISTALYACGSMDGSNQNFLDKCQIPNAQSND